MKSILIIGQNGQVSTYLQRALGAPYSVIVAGRQSMDLSQPAQIQAALDQFNPSLIINPAAYTAVDQAEQDREAAFTINRDAVSEIAAWCRAHNKPLIHYSTDYVFDGAATEPYTEQDAAAPSGVYGQSKYEGEQAILRSGAPAIILRTSWVYSNHGKNFYRTMLKLAETRNQLTVVGDQIGAPTYAGAIAQTTAELVDLIMQHGGIDERQIGVYHLTCAGETSWCEFARAIFEAHGVAVAVSAITTAEYPTPAKRPAYSVLSNAKLKQEFGLALPDWQQALQQCVAEARFSEPES
ncbi:MAG: dTDP-4-dehydrorhamnose reductase [Gammaproteobacteria bacterium]|nr:dTDP-4-dehydrorhamnose reductase [Gammaproteobacteria bacterium]